MKNHLPKRMLFAVTLLTAAIACGSCQHANLCLASGGNAHYTLVIDAGASPTERFCADELAAGLSAISGAEFFVSDQVREPALFIGTSDRFLQFPALAAEESMIAVRRENIYLMGGGDRGVTYAVYDFLRRLGCDWIAPEYAFFEGSASRIPRKELLRYRSQGDIRAVPAFAYRKFYVEEGKTHTVENLQQLIDWMPKLKFNTLVFPTDYQGSGRVRWDNWREVLIPELQKRGIIIEVGGHGYENFLNARMENGTLFDRHPEWFGMDGEGRRSRDPHTVFCTSNPDAEAYLQRNVTEYLRDRPEIDIFDFWPPDMEKWCACPQCVETPPEKRHVELVNRMAGVLKAQAPDVKLECLAYSRYVTPPEGVTLDPSVLLDFCAVTQHFERQFYEPGNANNEMYNRSLLAWLDAFEGEVSIYSYYRKYKWRSLPNVFPHYLQRDIRYFHEIGTQGVSIYSEPGDWFTYGPNYYVLGHLLQDPGTNVDALMRRYAEQLFGPAADTMLNVYAVLEKVVRAGCYFPDSEPKPVGQYDEYAARISEADRSVAAAMTEYASDPLVSRHLARVRLMLEYAVGSVRQQQELVREGKRGDYRLTEEWKIFFRRHKGEGVFVI